MTIWLVRAGACFPPGLRPRRKRRVEMLLSQLEERAHEVVIWSSTFDHITRSHVFNESTTLHLSDSVLAHYLHAPGYTKNVSLARMFNHYVLGRQFTSAASKAHLPDLIYSCLPTIELAERSARLGAAAGVPVVIDVRDVWPEAFLSLVPAVMRPAARLAAAPLYRWARTALRLATSVIAVSETYLAWARALGQRGWNPLDKVFPLGYEMPAVTEPAITEAERQLEALGVSREKVTCWFSGVFGASPDLKVILDCAARLLEMQMNGVQFVISGDGPGRKAVEARCQTLPNVVFTGWVGPAQIRALMRLADIGLATYVRDATQSVPNKLFEYFAAGIPVITSLPGEASNLIQAEGCGLHYQPEDAASLAQAVGELAADPVRRRESGRRARALFVERFSAGRLYPALLDHLERVRQIATPAARGIMHAGPLAARRDHCVAEPRS